MKTFGKLSIALFIFMGVGPGTAGAANTHTGFPDKPIRFIIPNNAGSSVDTTGRIFANAYGSALGQQLVVDNRGGAGGAIGMEIGKDALPDGYTLIWASTAAMTIRPHVRKKLPYDPLKDYEFITLCGITPNILVVFPAVPPKTVQQFIDWVKASPGKINMASAGVGSQSHLAGAALAVAAGLKPLHVPYKGGGSSMVAMVAGESHWTLIPAPAGMAHVKAGRLRVLGHSLNYDSPMVAGIPKISDTMAGFNYSGWLGLLAPKGTPKPILTKLYDVAVVTLNSAATKKSFENSGALTNTSTSAAFYKFVAQEIIDTGKVARAAGLKPE
mgnify:CR=1 FL=1